MEIVIGWVVMAIVCAMVATSKRGAGTGVAFFFYGLFVWPIALTHAILLKSPSPKPINAEGLINGKPYWRSPDGQFCTNVDGKEIAFANIEMLTAALGGEPEQNVS